MNLSNNIKFFFLSLITSICISSNTIFADELDDTLAKVKQLVTEKNYSAALEELSWARKEIEKMIHGL